MYHSTRIPCDFKYQEMLEGAQMSLYIGVCTVIFAQKSAIIVPKVSVYQQKSPKSCVVINLYYSDFVMHHTGQKGNLRVVSGVVYS
jgi:hypothetical protein